jgi:hypothetical protein
MAVSFAVVQGPIARTCIYGYVVQADIPDDQCHPLWNPSPGELCLHATIGRVHPWQCLKSCALPAMTRTL